MNKIVLFSSLIFVGFINAQQDSLKIREAEILKEVSIIGIRKEYIKVEADKTTINIQDNGLLNTGSSAEAVKRLPGVILTPDGSMKLNGKAIQIQIDNVPSPLSGQDLLNYLSGLPAGAIEKVELIYNPCARFDANASGSIINLIMSSKKMKGIAGNFNINYNFNKYQKPSPQIMFNGKINQTSWNFLTGYNYIDGESLNTNNQDFFAYNKSLNQRNLTLTTTRNFYLRTGFNHKINKKSNILFNYNGNFANDHDDFNSTTTGYIKEFLNKGITKNKNQNNEFILQYKTKLDTIGSTMDVVAYTSLFDKNPIQRATDNFNELSNSSQDFNLLNYYGKIDFSFPIKKGDFKLNTGSKYNVIDLQNNGNYSISGFNTTKYFDYLEKNIALYAELSKKYKKWNFMAGLRYEDFRVERIGIDDDVKTPINFKNSNFFPNFNVNYDLNSSISLNASYSKKIQQPFYGQLDPNNGGYFDRYSASQGNLTLEPSFYDNFEFKITAFQYATLGVNYSIQKDINVNVNDVIDENNPSIIKEEPITNSTNKQFSNARDFNIFANLPIPFDLIFRGKEEFQKRSQTGDINLLNITAVYGKALIKDFESITPNNGYWYFNTMGQFVFPYKVKSTFNYMLVPENGSFQTLNLLKSSQSFDVSLTREFLNKKLTLGVHAFDIFNQQEWNFNNQIPNLNSMQRNKQDTRVFRISLSWNFGKLKSVENSTIEADKIQKGGGGLIR